MQKPANPTLSAEIQQDSIPIGSMTRKFLEYVAHDISPHSPLVIVLHGSLMDAKSMREGTGYEFDQLADQHGFVVVYPDGYKHNWNTAMTDCLHVNVGGDFQTRMAQQFLVPQLFPASAGWNYGTIRPQFRASPRASIVNGDFPAASKLAHALTEAGGLDGGNPALF